jgi:glycosyltransferase involved in cell wall biosynthesis
VVDLGHGKEVMGRPRITLTVITKNEEDRIGDCLDSAALADFALVLDSGSTDRTAEIAGSKGARVEVHPFDGHKEQKDRAVRMADTDWILALDADERLSPELAEEIEKVLDGDDLPAAFSMPRRTFYLGRWIDHGGWYPDRKVRLFDRNKARWGGVNPHDHVQVDGEVRKLRGDIHHYSYRSMSDHLKQIDFFTTISAEQKLEAGMKPGILRMLFHPIGKFLRMYFLKLGFLDGRAGFIVAVLGSYYVFLKYAKLSERVRRGD